MEKPIVTSDFDRQRRQEGALFLVLFALTIPTANWLIGHVGTSCVTPQGPCVVPVAPGLMAPSGVMLVGVALVLRDLVQRRLGTALSALAILSGSALSALLAPASLVAWRDARPAPDDHEGPGGRRCAEPRRWRLIGDGRGGQGREPALGRPRTTDHERRPDPSRPRPGRVALGRPDRA